MGKPGTINVAVIGLGWVTTHRHIPILANHPFLSLHGIVDNRSDRIGGLAQRYPAIRTSVSDDGEMPWGEEIQAVLVATDPLNHYRLAKKMLMTGRHVLVEKPLAMTPEECLDLEETATRMGLVCCVMHNFQFARSVQALQALLREGQLGTVQGLEAIQLSNPRRRLPSWYEALPFGLFYDESPHLLYLLEALAGEPINHLSSAVVRAAGRNTPLAVTAYYQAGNSLLRLNMNFEAAISEWHVMLMGTKRIAIVDVFRDVLMVLPNDGLHRAREILATSASAFLGHAKGVLGSGIRLARGGLFYGADVVWDKFLGAIQGKYAPAGASVSDGRRVVELQHELMIKSASFEFLRHEDPGAK